MGYVTGLRALAAAAMLLAGAWVSGADPSRNAADTDRLEAVFRTCVSLYGHPLAGALMRSIGDSAARDAFAGAYPAAVRGFSLEHEHGYSTATAILKDGVSIAGVPARAIYASTCELDCPLAVWGLEFGPLKTAQRKALQAWVESAPSTHTDIHGDIKVQLSTGTDGQTLLVCDVSG
jgi:hypothetical protein